MATNDFTGHSPGPWKFRSIPGHLFELLDADGNPILRIRGGMMPMLADARLLAASPDLLAALDDDDDDDPDDDDDDAEADDDDDDRDDDDD